MNEFDWLCARQLASSWENDKIPGDGLPGERSGINRRQGAMKEQRLAVTGHLAGPVSLRRMDDIARSLPRFFVSPEQIVDGRVTIPGEDAHKISRVLRLRHGEEIAVLDNTGDMKRCELEEVKGVVTARIVGTERLDTEPATQVIIAQSLPKGDKLEQVVRQCTEAGAAGFWALQSERCVVRLDSVKGATRIARLQRVAREAAEQSSRARIPEVSGVFSLPIALTMTASGTPIVMYEGAAPPLKERLTANLRQPIVLFIGPEGGWAPSEVDLASASGAKLASMGPRVLRTETAGLVALASILYALEP